MKYPLMDNNISRHDLDLVIKHLQQDNPRLTNGPKCREFEEAWSKWLGVKYSVFVNSGSSANLLSLKLLQISGTPGGEVIVPPFTWSSDIISIINCGFTPVFVDIDLDTLGMNTEGILNAITENTKAVFITYAQGYNCLTDKLLNELEKRMIFLIEDVCESHGATHNGKKLGTFGTTSNFSFYFAHHMSTIEGGMICTNNYITYNQLRMLRSHGLLRESDNEVQRKTFAESHSDLNPEFIFTVPGFNVRNNEIGAIIGLNQLRNLEENVIIRNNNHNYFLNSIDKNKYKVNFNTKGCSNYALNIVLQPKYANDKFVQQLMNALRKQEIEFRRGSAGGGNQLRQPYLKNYFQSKAVNEKVPDYYLDYPNTEHMHFYSFYVGNYPSLDSTQLHNLVTTLNEV